MQMTVRTVQRLPLCVSELSREGVLRQAGAVCVSKGRIGGGGGEKGKEGRDAD